MVVCWWSMRLSWVQCQVAVSALMFADFICMYGVEAGNPKWEDFPFSFIFFNLIFFLGGWWLKRIPLWSSFWFWLEPKWLKSFHLLFHQLTSETVTQMQERSSPPCDVLCIVFFLHLFVVSFMVKIERTFPIFSISLQFVFLAHLRDIY